MAALDGTRCRQVWVQEGARKAALFALSDVSGNDTVDLAGMGFARVIAVALLAVSGAGPSGTPGLPGGAVVALPSGLSHDAAYLLVDGITG